MSYLEQKLQLKGIYPEYSELAPIVNVAPIAASIEKLRKGEGDFVYLPNTRWFRGEEAKDESAIAMARSLSALADVFINDAFGSWQAHCSTVGIAANLPSAAGLLMQKEVSFLSKVFEPKRNMLAVVAGSKFDTKIGPLSSLIKVADLLVLGGVIYNAYLCVKYGITIQGVGEEDLTMAAKFIEDTKPYAGRVVEIPIIIESDSMDNNSSWRMHKLAELVPGTKLNYVLDAAPLAFEDPKIKELFDDASTIFVNAVMGYTTFFPEGTKAMYSLINQNKKALKLFGGGDTLQDFKELLPGIYGVAVNDPSYYFFTGGGAILDAIQQGSAYGMKPVQALLQD